MAKVLKQCKMFPYQDFSNFGFDEFLSSLFYSQTFLTFLMLQNHAPIDLDPWILLAACLNGFNLLQEKNTRNEYIFEKYFKLTYLRVIKHELL